MKIGTLLLRTTIGGFFVGHGAQKLFGVAGGHGLKGTSQYFESLGLRPGTVHAGLAGVAETGGGLGLALGYRTPLSAAAVVSVMATAIHRVHLKNGWNIQDGGFEYNAVLIAGAVAIAESGPGFLSLDALRGKQRSGILPAAFALGAGVGGAAAAYAVAEYFGDGGSGLAPTSAPPAATVEEAVQEPAQAPLQVEHLNQTSSVGLADPFATGGSADGGGPLSGAAGTGGVDDPLTGASGTGEDSPLGA